MNDDQNLSLSQRGLLDWIGGDGVARYHECSGDDLTRLVALGLVEIVDGNVLLTAAGRALAFKDDDGQ